MNISVVSTTRFTEKDQFDPLELATQGLLTLAHEDCGGGHVKVTVKGLIWKTLYFTCNVCKHEEQSDFENAIQAIRLTLLGRAAAPYGNLRFSPATPNDSHSNQQP